MVVQLSSEHISHADISEFAEDHVNLKRDRVQDKREQVNRLRKRLESYISENPSFSLKKMYLSGSLAKGTALRNLNDIDVATYITPENEPSSGRDLVDFLASRLSEIPNVKEEQIKRNQYSVSITFSATGLTVDMVPILSYSNETDDGYLVSQDDGSFLKTNIPKHLEFIRKRKKYAGNDRHFAQIIRLVKYWAKLRKGELADQDFRFKSFMIELLAAKWADFNKPFQPYPDALCDFFAYISGNGMNQQLVFSDYVHPNSIKDFSDPIRIIDPVNGENNVARLYTTRQRELIVNEAMHAADAIEYGMRGSKTKSDTIYAWQQVFGRSFR